MNNLGFNSASTNIFGQDLDSSSSPEFQSVKVNKVVLKGQDVDIENLEVDDGVIFYDRAAKRAKLSTSDGVVSSTQTLAFATDLPPAGTYLNLTGGTMDGPINDLRTEDSVIALGFNAGSINQGASCIAIGDGTGYSGQGDYSIAIGTRSTGVVNQHASSLLINAKNGFLASTESNQIKLQAGTNILDATTSAITYQGNSIAGDFKSDGSVALTGPVSNLRTAEPFIRLGQGAFANGNSISIGQGSGGGSQSNDAIALGADSGHNLQGLQAIAIGRYAGYQNQGANSIAIGADAGVLDQPAESIVLSAKTGAELVPSSSNEFLVQAGTTTFKADATSITHQGNSIAGDFKSDGSVPMSADLQVPTINGLSPTGGKWASTVSSTILYNPVPTFSSLFGATGVGSLSVAANGWQIGTTGCIKIGGVLTSPNNGAHVIRIVGGNPTDGLIQIWTSGAVAIASVTTAQFWELELEFTIRSLGDAEINNLGFNGNFRYLTNGNNMEGQTISGEVSLDTTIENIFGADIQLNTAAMAITTHVASLSTLY